MNKEIEILKNALRCDLPGKKAQELMMPESRGNFDIPPDNNTKISSILIGIFLKNHEYHTVLFQRPDYDGDHSGQVCFPGGKKEAGDKNLMDTAIREAWEEVGIRPDKVEILGKLTPLHIPVSNYIVHPFVGYISYNPVFKPDPLEVSKIIVTPVRSFKLPENKKTGTMHLHHTGFNIPYYAIEKFKIWGATAMIISEWITLLDGINFPHTNLYSAGNAQ